MSTKYLRNFILMMAILKYILLRKCVFVLAIKGIHMGKLISVTAEHYYVSSNGSCFLFSARTTKLVSELRSVIRNLFVN